MGESARLATRLACVGIVVCVVFPLGQILFPTIAQVVGSFPFRAIEAVVTTTVGFGLFEALFG
jgi:hypothetical protein